MTGAHNRTARGLLMAAALFGVCSVASAIDPGTAAAKHALLSQHKSSSTVTNGILSVDYDTFNGRFSIRTGASHPSPNQTVFFGVGTSYITLRDATSQQTFVNCATPNPGISGYTAVSMCNTTPVITPLGTGFRATYTLTNWIVQQDVEINGSTLADTNVRHKVTVTNTSHQTRHYGVRYLWDWEVAGNDRSYFRARNPDGAGFLGPQQFTDFPNPTFQLFEEVDSPESPLFHVFGTVGGGSLIPTPTTPDQVRYASWGDAYSSAWDFTEGSSDSATVHFWGYNSPLTLHGGDSATFVEYVTTQFSAVTPPSAQVTMSSGSLSFGDVPVGASSAQQTVTITSTGEVPYQINSFGATANCQASAFCTSSDFVCSTDCATAPASYGRNASCHVNATFAPNATGPQSAVIYICDNATGSPRSITLTGNGTPPASLRIAPSTYDFGNVLVGDRSPATAFTITNPGSAPAAIGAISTLGAFAIDFIDCGTSVAAGGSCTVRVLFAPTLPGRSDGWLVVPDAATGAQTRASLLGTGIQEARLQAPVAVDLGAYTLGTPPIAQTVRLSNIGNAVVTLGRMSVDAPFTLETDCPLNLAPGQSCGVRLGFSSQALGDFHAVATIESNAVGGALQISVAARAVPAPIAIIRVSPLLIGFGDRIIGTTSPAQRVTVANEGSAPAIFTGTNISIDFVIVSTTCGTSLAASQTCTVDVAMRALSAGPVGGQLVVNSNAASGGRATVELSGTGCRPFTSPSNRFGTRSACSP
jgi:hypothetical protein